MKKMQLKGLAFGESTMLSKEEKKQLMGGDQYYIVTCLTPSPLALGSFSPYVCYENQWVPCNQIPPSLQGTYCPPSPNPY